MHDYLSVVALAMIFALALFLISTQDASITSRQAGLRSESVLIFEVKASVDGTPIPRATVSCDGVLDAERTTNHNGLAVFSFRKMPILERKVGTISCRIYKREFQPKTKGISLIDSWLHQTVVIDLHRESTI